MKPIAVPGGTLEALEWGPADGRPVVCLHGFPDIPATFAPLAALLAAAGRRVVAPWLRGYAPSTLAGPYGLNALAEDLVAVADAVGPPVDVVGHDWGAFAVYAACATAPERIRRAVTLAVPHPAVWQRNFARAKAQVLRSWYIMLFQVPRVAEWALARSDFALVDRLWRDWSPGFAPPREHLTEVKRCLGRSMPAPISHYRAQRRFEIARPRAPLLALHGADDGCVLAQLAAGQERVVESAEILDGVGHFLHLERPALVADRVLAWLDRSPGAVL